MTGPSAERPSPERPAPDRPSPSRPAASVEVRRRGFLEVRWRQLRRAPRPVVRAVASSLSVALVLGIAFLAYDLALDRGAALPGGDLRLLALVVYVVIVLVAGALVTWLMVPLPAGAAGRRATRTPWSAALGLFAAVPIAYLVLVVLHELVKPLLA